MSNAWIWNLKGPSNLEGKNSKNKTKYDGNLKSYTDAVIHFIQEVENPGVCMDPWTCRKYKNKGPK